MYIYIDAHPKRQGSLEDAIHETQTDDTISKLKGRLQNVRENLEVYSSSGLFCLYLRDIDRTNHLTSPGSFGEDIKFRRVKYEINCGKIGYEINHNLYNKFQPL